MPQGLDRGRRALAKTVTVQTPACAIKIAFLRSRLSGLRRWQPLGLSGAC
ncbi:hypothetical protein CtesDRAFT_PD5247 [Comamonas testosteroni KF-1]|uniref:Uncharacterized protein n=1 Tax=Comamonas testosteroni (strain DSM 14576 / KF-1) TaxID=399795 RepID=B7X370_COMTK|nr:hypothetical protein CtesDRAFT_PD5247 [Comamonas testosteroni KF-1]